MSKELGELIVKECKAEEFQDCDIVFSGLDSDVAGEIGMASLQKGIHVGLIISLLELQFLKANLPVFSNAKNHRRNPYVPLIVPTVNLSHMNVIPYQRGYYGQKKGFLVCNSNCAVIGIAIPLAALQAKFGLVDQVSVVTMQAVSGAGWYPGVSSMDILDNGNVSLS